MLVTTVAYLELAAAGRWLWAGVFATRVEIVELVSAERGPLSVPEFATRVEIVELAAAGRWLWAGVLVTTV
ncbi:hypothetical protein [Streptomyces sp. NPDC006446]|uniref:hypothetical protein n=1 Tax=Streptomyces sp. NPDC006446 TaxID=3154301 RepID=UPI0033BBE7FB